MSSINVGVNIANAFKVVYETYDNVQKMMSFLVGHAEKNGYICCCDNPLTWSTQSKLNSSIYGWAYGRFVLVFRRAKDKMLAESQYEGEGSLFICDVNLGYFDKDVEEEAMVYLARFDYSKSVWPKPNRLWLYDQPIHWKEVTTFENKGKYSFGTRAGKDDYYSLKHVIKCSVPLIEITREKVEEKIFEEFNLLASLEMPETSATL